MNNKELSNIISQLKDAYEGDPWFGRAVLNILAEVDERIVFEKPGGQHSIVELLWHMITWREFTIDRLQHSPQMTLAYFEEMDWRELDHSDRTLWKQGLERLQETQAQLLALLKDCTDELLDQDVRERNYPFRKLLYGIIQHDIYHLGQVAYIQKLLKATA
ncbi:DinB family protein [Flavisolibacter tropicus]|uniref:DinB family protein n=1 Tax=Flavisolibacter tropicus TaxID=1492898 RepID=UPI0008356235|nr:DinB family protein [Flavisolibacter tropicus]